MKSTSRSSAILSSAGEAKLRTDASSEVRERDSERERERQRERERENQEAVWLRSLCLL